MRAAARQGGRLMRGDHCATAPIVLLESHNPSGGGRSFRFADPAGQIVARTPEEVKPALEAIERAAAAGRHAAGFVSYEAAPAFDAAFRAKPLSGLPLLWFGLFDRRLEAAPGAFGADEPFTLSDWTAAIDADAYARVIERIREYIAAGDTYQVNFTFPRHATFEGEPIGLYRALCRSQRADFCAYIDLGDRKIVCASPELFFRLQSREVTLRPMKGTMARGRWLEEDEALARALAACPKNRAENVMIVDLMRNDLGRVAETGSVAVASLCEVERYETVHQLTSTIRGRLRAGVGLPDLFGALFPSGSVTGAPKIRTMAIIEAIEREARGIYTGAIGFVSPGPDAVFNVAIRTVLLEREAAGAGAPVWRATFGVGGGITYDSDAAREYEECAVKSRFLLDARPDFALLETLLYEAPSGWFLLARHLERLERSARYFGLGFDRARIEDALGQAAGAMREGCFRVRLLLARDGCCTVTHAPLVQATTAEPPIVALAKRPVDSGDPFLFHKTTRREPYTTRAQARPDCFDVILVNERGELTESTIANLVVAREGRLLTPPLSCGLLPGTFRAELLSRGQIEECVLDPEDLERAEAIYLINSVRKWVRVRLAS